MKEVIHTVASELAIQCGESIHPASDELQNEFYTVLRHHARTFLQYACTWESIVYTYRRKHPNRNLSEVLEALPPLPQGSKYVLLFPCKIRFQVTKRDTYYYQVKSFASRRLKKKTINRFGHFS